MSELNSIVPKSRFRRLAKGSAFSSDRVNATIEELIQEVQELQAFHNDVLVPTLNALPMGADDDEFPSIGDGVDALTLGISGDQIWIDNTATSESDGIFYSEIDNRKLTIKESVLALSSRIDANFATVQDLIEAVDAGVSSYTRDYIGLTAFDSTLSSSGASMDGRLSAASFNISQLKADTFGSPYSLDGDGNANLSYSLRQIVDALLDQHGGAAYKSGYTYPSTITLSGPSVATGDLVYSTAISSSWIGNVLPVTSQLARAGTVTNLEHEIKRLRFEIARLKSPGATWNNDTGIAPTYSTAVISLGQHINQYGNGTATADNPHGVADADIEHDNTTSSLPATTVKEAIEVLATASSANLYLPPVTFINLPSDDQVRFIFIPTGYRLTALYLRHEDGNVTPIVPTAGTLTVQKDLDSVTLTNQLSAASIDLTSLSAEGTMLSVTDIIDAGDGTLLNATVSNREYTFPEVLKITGSNIACNTEAELHVWAKVTVI